jgi:hypothetical protein
MRRARRQQRGFILIVLVIVVAGAAAFVLHFVNAASWRADRHQVTHRALLKAKEALVARAVTDDNRPGSLPCPDTDNDGQAELFAGNACPSYVGRLPWQTLGLPDLRDGSGERLWYVLSPSHRDHPAAEPINSNTAGLLNILGGEPAAGLLAVVISPGHALMRAGAAAVQNRDCSVPANCLNAINYLDVSGAVDNADADMNLARVTESETFNDRLMAVSADDVMPLVEKRTGREFAQKLRDHFDAWQSAANVTPASRKGFYPWAAAFNDPSTASPGVNGTLTGQLPLSAANVVWSAAPAPTFTLGLCVGAGTTQITCSGLVVCVLACVTTITARVEGIATAFVDPPNGTEVTTSGLLIGGAPASTWTLNPAAQALDFSYSGGTVLGVGLVQVQVNVPAASAWASSAAYWPTANSWHQVAHYAVSAEYAIDGAGVCGGTCLTVGNTVAPNNDKQAVVTMTGRTLSGQAARPVTPPANVADYLEAANQTPADLVLEQNLRTPAFNDQPVVVRP